MQQHRNIEVSGATLECALCGSGPPVVLLANAGCSTGYFDELAHVLAAGGLQAISINMQEIRDRVATKVRFNSVVETGVPGFIPRDR